MNIPNETLKASCRLSDKSARAAVEAGIRMGIISKPASPFIHARPVKPIPKPDLSKYNALCPECQQQVPVKTVAGDKYFTFHHVSDFPLTTKGMNIIKIYFDGGYGRIAYGSYEIEGEGCNHRFERMEHFGQNTSNTAEYRTMIAALKWLRHNLADPNGAALEIYSDSKLLVEQMSGRWKIKVLHIRELVIEAQMLLAVFPSRRFIWHRRHHNVARFGH